MFISLVTNPLSRKAPTLNREKQTSPCLFWLKNPLSQNMQGDNLYYQMNHAHPSLPNSMHEPEGWGSKHGFANYKTQRVSPKKKRNSEMHSELHMEAMHKSTRDWKRRWCLPCSPSPHSPVCILQLLVLHCRSQDPTNLRVWPKLPGASNIFQHHLHPLSHSEFLQLRGYAPESQMQKQFRPNCWQVLSLHGRSSSKDKVQRQWRHWGRKSLRNQWSSKSGENNKPPHSPMSELELLQGLPCTLPCLASQQPTLVQRTVCHTKDHLLPIESFLLPSTRKVAAEWELHQTDERKHLPLPTPRSRRRNARNSDASAPNAGNAEAFATSSPCEAISHVSSAWPVDEADAPPPTLWGPIQDTPSWDTYGKLHSALVENPTTKMQQTSPAIPNIQRWNSNVGSECAVDPL